LSQKHSFVDEGSDRGDKRRRHGRASSLIDQKQSKIDEINGLDEEFNACFTALKQKLGVKSLDEAGTLGIKGVKNCKAWFQR